MSRIEQLEQKEINTSLPILEVSEENKKLMSRIEQLEQTVKEGNASLPKLDLSEAWTHDLDQLEQRLTVKVEDMGDELQGEIDSVQRDINDMQNANSALCAYQDIVGGNNGLSGNIVVYDTTHLETNGASCSLDKSPGKFTAGKSGVYQISVSAQAGKTVDSSYFRLYLRTSSGNYQDGYEAYIAFQQAVGTSDLKTPLNAIRFITLQQGETAWLEYTTTSTSCAIYKLKFCVSLYK